MKPFVQTVAEGKAVGALKRFRDMAPLSLDKALAAMALEQELVGLCKILSQAPTPSAGDVIYVRHGMNGMVPAFVREVGAGTHEGLLRVAKWSERGDRLMSDRWTSPIDFRGFPDERTAERVMRQVTHASS